MDIQKAHGLIRHIDEKLTRTTARQLRWLLTCCRLKSCLHRAKAKAKQKNVDKESTAPKAGIPGGRVYLDLLKVDKSKMDGSEFELTNKRLKTIVNNPLEKWCDFTRTKKGWVECTFKFLHKMRQGGIPISYGSVWLEKVKSSKTMLGVLIGNPCNPLTLSSLQCETPQHNNVAELSFLHISRRAQAMMRAAHVPNDFLDLAVKAIKCAVQLDKVVQPKNRSTEFGITHFLCLYFY